MFGFFARPKVLIIDDDASVRRLVRARLEKKEGVDVLEAGDGGRGLDIAQSEKPDLILLDWLMPDVSGINVLIRLGKNENTKNIPVIMLTAKSKMADVEGALCEGAMGYLCKPPNLKEVGAKVREILDLERA